MATKRPRVDDGPGTLSTTVVGEVPRTSSLAAPTMLLTGHGDAVLSVKFAPNGLSLASGSRDKSVYLWSVQGDCKVRGPGGRAPRATDSDMRGCRCRTTWRCEVITTLCSRCSGVVMGSGC